MRAYTYTHVYEYGNYLIIKQKNYHDRMIMISWPRTNLKGRFSCVLN
jgi:hypothetical protein